MQKISLLLLVVVIFLGIGAVLLTHGDIPAQSKQTEKVLPDGMFPK